MQGNRNVTGKVEGTGALINVDVGFVPSRVKIYAPTMEGFWDEDLEDGGFAFTNIETVLSGNVAIGVPALTLASGDAAPSSLGSDALFVAAASTRVAVAAGDRALTATTHDVAATYWNTFLISAVTAGTLTATIGTAKLDRASALAAIGTLPALSVPMGVLVISAGTSAFDATTTLLTALAAQGGSYEFLRFGGILSGGITRKGVVQTDTYRGFTIGTNANINIASRPIYYEACR